MTYTAKIIDTQISNGEEYVWARYTADDGTYLEPAPLRNASPTPGWADERINAELDRLNAFVPSGVKIGDPAPKKDPVPPTQDELDRQAYAVALSDYKTKKTIFESPLNKVVTQQDVDTALAVVKPLYKPEYGAFV